MAFNNASGIGIAEGFKKAWELKGHKVIEAVVYEPNQPSYRSELQKVLFAKPDVIIMGSYIADTTIIIREWFETGETQKWLIPGHAVGADLIKAVGPEASEGLMVVNSISNEASTAFSIYDAAYRKAMNESGVSNIMAAASWDMLIVLRSHWKQLARMLTSWRLTQKSKRFPIRRESLFQASLKERKRSNLEKSTMKGLRQPSTSMNSQM